MNWHQSMIIVTNLKLHFMNRMDFFGHAKSANMSHVVWIYIVHSIHFISTHENYNNSAQLWFCVFRLCFAGKLDIHINRTYIWINKCRNDDCFERQFAFKWDIAALYVGIEFICVLQPNTEYVESIFQTPISTHFWTANVDFLSAECYTIEILRSWIQMYARHVNTLFDGVSLEFIAYFRNVNMSPKYRYWIFPLHAAFHVLPCAIVHF